MADIRVSIDRGGTFCDVLAEVDGREPIVFKLLSEDPANYPDAPSEAIRRILEQVTGTKLPVHGKLDGSRIASCRVGTTVATNALLEHKGEKFAFVTTKGFKDVCTIGDQTRPHLFTLKVRKPRPLHAVSVEVDERVTIEDYDLNPSPMDKSSAAVDADPALVRTPAGEVIRVLTPVDRAAARATLQTLRAEGYTSVAISFMHSYLYPEHEDAVAEIAREVGFEYITTSARTSPVIKLLNRSSSVCSEAYLYPVIRRYIEGFEGRFSTLPQRVEYMCSDGGLRQASTCKGNEALLSGPAGGVVGIAQSCYDKEQGSPIIGFDMGGTSTDVSRYDGQYDYLSSATIAGRVISAPMLNIATVAAGGGSILFVRNGLLAVGPESAGAHPGPACYRKGGPLTVTDANLFLGRLVLSSFPAIFGKDANEPLDTEVVRQKFADITAEFNAQTGQKLTPEEVALGFLNVANETMSRPIRNSTGNFGGAGGQHACAIAEKLGIKRILIHKWSSLLSAYGISQALLQTEKFEPYSGNWTPSALPHLRTRLDSLRAAAHAELTRQGATEDSLVFTEALVMRYFGTETHLTISKPADEDYAAAFTASHRREFDFVLDRKIVIESVLVRGTGSAIAPAPVATPMKALETLKANGLQTPVAQETQMMYAANVWKDVSVFRLEAQTPGSAIAGPAMVIDKTQTIVVEAGYVAYITKDHVIIEKDAAAASKLTAEAEASAAKQNSDDIDPIQLSVFAHRFMAIAEQMGNTLQRTSISTSIRERLDFSCAIFSKDGRLVANAPHIPIHLGSMQLAIQYQHKEWEGKLQPGDVLLTNHPLSGGTHLPDLTIVSPVFIDGSVAFYVASRGHHTDIGGKGITSMMPESRELWEEGMAVKSMKIISQGKFLEKEIIAEFEKAGAFPGCSPTRRLADNLSDLRAQAASNHRGIVLLEKLCSEFTLPVVQRYMLAIRGNAEQTTRSFFRDIAKKHPNGLTAEDSFDDGTKLVLKITADPETGSAVFDWTGTGSQSWGNYNCPISITYSAVIYSVRCLIDMDVPLNDGCLAPITISIPYGTILNPTPRVAICGSTLASQRVIDTILRAFARCAAFQGCASSFGWGMGGRDAQGIVRPGWNYGEALGGGAAAGPGWHGESAVQSHSTNTRNTDPEVIEKRTQVLVTQYKIRKNSGGRGKWRGGNGVVREIEARIPLKFSILSDRRVSRPYGMNGGEDGKAGANYLFKFNEEGVLERINWGGKATAMVLPGERVQINTPGGGGWGEPDDFEAMDEDMEDL
ncbi:hypothetical protein TD95_001418 [Thielaviopsis punctulata]|uniref:Hydantoinase B/oxoprolinase domain-containing protein n=1 Tax=Thielaviopsis punctulata TaxID=72032 RepID=A0A0F4Z8E9_9PEZI|nr:hypothetical protein TD95_001418 [Thielaviopsis punctulata]